MLAQAALLKAIKYCGSKQKNLAKLIGEDPDKISFWLNRAKQIPFHQAIAIEAATDCTVSRYDLAPYARFSKKLAAPIQQSVASTEATITEKVLRGIQMEKALGKRQGTRSDLGKLSALRRNCDEVKGRTSALVSAQAGFSSRDTYLRAKKVVDKGIFQLLQAMDQKQISISQAALISELPPAKQESILQIKDRHELMDHLRGIKSTKTRKSPVTDVRQYDGENMLRIFFDENLIREEVKRKIALRLPLIGLMFCYGAKAYFPWQPEELRNRILPNNSLDFISVLEALRELGLIKRVQIEGEEAGKFVEKK